MAIGIMTVAMGGPGCGMAEQPAASATPSPLPAGAGKKDEFTRKERAKMNEMDREEMLEYKKKLREERAKGEQGSRPSS